MSFHNLAGRDISSSVIINREKVVLALPLQRFKLLSDIFVNDKLMLLVEALQMNFLNMNFIVKKMKSFCLYKLVRTTKKSRYFRSMITQRYITLKIYMIINIYMKIFQVMKLI